MNTPGTKTAICSHCGTTFPARRSTARYCSDLCRIRKARGIPPEQRLALPRGDAKRWRSGR